VHETTHDALLTEHDIRGVYQKRTGTRHIEMNRVKNWDEKGGVKKAENATCSSKLLLFRG